MEIMERLEYETQYGESTYKFVEEGGWVSLYVNDKMWGASDGDRFIKALLQDIRELEMLVKNKNIEKLDENECGEPATDKSEEDVVYVVQGRSGIVFSATSNYEKALSVKNDLNASEHDRGRMGHWENNRHVLQE